MDQGLKIEVEERTGEGAVTILRVAGEIDLSNAEDLAAAVEVRGPAPSTALVLDLVEVPFIDSTGLRVVLTAANDHGTRFALLVAPDGAVAHMLDLLGVADRVPAFESEELAVDAAVSGRGGADV